MTDESLILRLHLLPAGLRLVAVGELHAGNAHLLSNVVVGTLRRYATPALELDLTHLRSIDHVGVCALLDSRREADRRGILLTVNCPQGHVRDAIARAGARELVPRPPQRRHPPPLRRPQTGIVCRHNAMRRR